MRFGAERAAMATKLALSAPDGTDRTMEIASFAAAVGLESAAAGRYSLLLTLGLFGGFKSGHVDPAKVVHEIEALEGIGRPSQRKPPVQNRHPPLKGLWHKHYQETGLRSMALNLRMAMHDYGLPAFDAKVAAAASAGETRYMTEEDVKLIAHDAVMGNFLRRAGDQALTGEWIVFARHDGQNYYLSLATHDEQSHADVRSQIDAICCQEFPFLPALLASA
jgi:hypothetical protein